MIDVEKEFGIAIAPMGGVRIDSLPGYKRHLESADFVFPHDEIIAELKCLDVDQISSPGIVKRASELYGEELRQERSPVIAFGTLRLTTDAFSEEFRRKIERLYQSPIARVIRKADGQIGASKLAFPMQDGLGLLLVANNANLALHPQHLIGILGNIFSTEAFPNIDHVIAFSPNLPADWSGKDTVIWYSGGMPAPHRRISEPFLQRIQEAWFDHHAKIIGQPIETIFNPSDETLKSLRNIPKS